MSKSDEFYEAMVRAIGLDEAMRFIEQFGGCRISFHRENLSKSKTRFVAFVGVEAAQKIADELPQGFPNSFHLRMADGGGWRSGPDRWDAEIIAARKRGLPVSKIALQVGCTERHVWRRIAAMKAKGQIA